MSELDLDAVDPPYFPERLMLSDAMKARIDKGEIDEDEVRQKTFHFYSALRNLTNHDGSWKSDMRLSLTYTVIKREYERDRHAIDLHSTDSNGDNLLSYALDKGYLPIARQLIQEGIATEHINSQGDNALSLSVMRCPGRTGLYQLAIDLGNSPYTSTAYGLQVADMLLLDNRLPELEWLIGQGINTEAILNKPNLRSKQPVWMKDGKNHTIFEALFEIARDTRNTEIMEYALDIRSRLVKHHEKWWQFQTNPDVSSLTRDDLIGFSNFGKLHELLDRVDWWRGKEEVLMCHLPTFPPFLSDEVIDRHPWVSQHLSASQATSSTRWTTRIEHGTTTERGLS